MLLTLTGGAGAGKTTLANELAATASTAPVQVLHGDDYYYSTQDRGVWACDDTGVLRLDVGDPQSMDVERLSYDTTVALAVSAVVIVEGLFARHVSPQAPCARFDVFVDLPADLRLVRKIQRKCVRDGFPLEVLLRNYLNHRRDAHERHIEPVRHHCELVVDGARDSGTLAHQVWSAIADQKLIHGS